MQFEVNTSFTSSKKMNLQTVESRMGKPILLYLGYRLLKKKTYKNENIFWVCAKNKSGCLGNATTNQSASAILSSKNHTCVPNIAFKYVPVICPIFKLGCASKNFR